MSYYFYDYPSAVTEEHLASIVCEGVKDYLSGVKEYVAQCQKRDSEQQETIDELTMQNQALQQQVDELKEHLKSYKTLHASSSVKNIYNRCDVVQHYQSEQTRIINPTFGAMYDIHDNEEVKAG